MALIMASENRTERELILYVYLVMIFKLLVTLTIIFKSVCDSHLDFCEYPTLKMPMISVKQ